MTSCLLQANNEDKVLLLCIGLHVCSYICTQYNHVCSYICTQYNHVALIYALNTIMNDMRLKCVQKTISNARSNNRSTTCVHLPRLVFVLELFAAASAAQARS